MPFKNSISAHGIKAKTNWSTTFCAASWRNNPIWPAIFLRMRVSTPHQNKADQRAPSVTEQSYWFTYFPAHACQYYPSTSGRKTSIFRKGAILLNNFAAHARISTHTHHQKVADQQASRKGGPRKPTNQRSSRRAGSGWSAQKYV